MATRKTSKKRQAILDALMATTEHPNAEWLYHKLKPEYPDLSLGTVYRNLSLFADAGDILRIGVLGGQERFDGRTDPHAHLLCAECGRVMDVETPGLEPKLCALAARRCGPAHSHSPECAPIAEDRAARPLPNKQLDINILGGFKT